MIFTSSSAHWQQASKLSALRRFELIWKDWRVQFEPLMKDCPRLQRKVCEGHEGHLSSGVQTELAKVGAFLDATYSPLEDGTKLIEIGLYLENHKLRSICKTTNTK